MYRIRFNPAAYGAGGRLENKIPKTFKSSLYLTFAGTNIWTTQTFTINATAISGMFTGLSKTFTIADYLGAVVGKSAKEWETEEITPGETASSSSSTGVGTNYTILLPSDRIANSVVTVIRKTPDERGKQTLLPGYDYQLDETNNEIELLTHDYDDEVLIIGFFTLRSRVITSTGLEALKITIQNLVNGINDSTGLGVIARIRNGIEIVLESIIIGTEPENADDITVMRANVASQEILINDEDVNGPINLRGFQSNMAHSSMGIMFNWNYQDDYFRLTGGYALRYGQIRTYTDDEFEFQPDNIKEDLARYVSKGILIVSFLESASSSGGGELWVDLTAFEVLHSGYEDVNQI